MEWIAIVLGYKDFITSPAMSLKQCVGLIRAHDALILRDTRPRCIGPNGEVFEVVCDRSNWRDTYAVCVVSGPK